MAEVHLIGQIRRALDFDDKSLFLRWSIDSGSYWKVVEGFSEGQTQLTTQSELEVNLFPRVDLNGIDRTIDSTTNQHWFCHPIDVHLFCSGLQGWPRFEIQVWGVDWLRRCNVTAYGYLAVPMSPGFHRLTCATWRPVGDLRRRIFDYLTGNRMQLIDPSNIISNGLNRHIIQTQSMGCVEVELNVIMKDFEKYGVEV